MFPHLLNCERVRTMRRKVLSVTLGRDHVPTGTPPVENITDAAATALSPVTNVDNTPVAALPDGVFHSDSKGFRDLVIFEERLQQNMIRFNKTRRRWEIALTSLVLATAYFAYYVFFDIESVGHSDSSPNREPKHRVTSEDVGLDPPHYHAMDPLTMFGFIVSSSMLAIFFLSGLYRQKLSNPSKFVAQCNRSLLAFNMQFNKERRGEIVFLRKVPRDFQEGFSEYREQYWAKKRSKT
ncbi:hypothetical protein BJ742DRAFT_792445 [Cladochytrium replicatum]|nr:hypothetical protein BJ742DRAFT_792445 [Cladochytrium replicatum]